MIVDARLVVKKIKVITGNELQRYFISTGLLETVYLIVEGVYWVCFSALKKHI
jgi:hypothetical protein